jgi:DNA invertase Pin-like site-specific DNA recombinase
MLNDASRRKFDVVMAWAVDRLGRSLIDLLGTIQLLEHAGVDIYLDKQNIDTTSPMGRLLFQVTGAFAEFERTIIKDRIKAGMSRVKADLEAQRKRNPEKSATFTSRKSGIVRRSLGRPGAEPEKLEQAKQLLAGGKGILNTARECGLGTSTVQRLKQEMASAT